MTKPLPLIALLSCLSLSCKNGITPESPPTAAISGVVFYDPNQNGVQDSTEKGIAGWKVALSDAAPETVYTDANGAYSFSVISAQSHMVEEILPSATSNFSFIATTPTSRISTLAPPITFNFGVICNATPGGLTAGYWHLNGCSRITHADVLALNAYCLVDTNGNPFDPVQASGCTVAFSDFLNLPPLQTSNVANRLSVQLAAAFLNVQHGFTLGTVVIDSTRSVTAEFTYANSLLCAHPLTNADSPSRTEQARVFAIFSKLNLGSTFTLDRCPAFTYPANGRVL